MGPRIVRYLALVVAGVLLGTVGTIGHEQSVEMFGHDVPWGIIAGLVGTAAYLTGVRLLTEGRIEAVAAAVGILLPIAVLSLEGPGGSVLVRTGALGEIWEYTPALIALIVVAWPSQLTRAAGASQAA